MTIIEELDKAHELVVDGDIVQAAGIAAAGADRHGAREYTAQTSSRHPECSARERVAFAPVEPVCVCGVCSNGSEGRWVEIDQMNSVAC